MSSVKKKKWPFALAAGALLGQRGHRMTEIGVQGAVSAILYNAEEDILEAAEDRRRTSSAIGF